MLLELVFWINLFCSCFMTGLIWYVQLVQYPSFSKVNENDFQEYLNFHSNQTDIIVKPVMSIEFATSGVLMWFATPLLSLQSLGFVLVLLIWIFTFIFSVPIHYQLEEQGNDLKLVSRLVQTNWLRTLLWSIKAITSMYLLYQ